MRELGYIEGQSVRYEFRSDQGQASRLPELAAELAASLAAKAATTTIPIVFAIGSDPVAMGLVPSLNRPGGNATGVSFQTVELVAKQFEMLRELAPGAM